MPIIHIHICLCLMKLKGNFEWLLLSRMREMWHPPPPKAVLYLAMSPSSLQLCTPWVHPHAASSGSKPSLTGRVSRSLPQTSLLFLSVVSHKHKPHIPGLAFLKCQKNCPKAFQPIKLSQTCKTEPLMKYINLEHWGSNHSVVLFAYKAPWETKGGRRRGGKKRKDTLDKHIIEEKSPQWLAGWNTLIHYTIFFKDEKNEALSPRSLIPLTKEDKKTAFSLDPICLADTDNVPTDSCIRTGYCASSFLKGFKKCIYPVLLLRWVDVSDFFLN